MPNAQCPMPNAEVVRPPTRRKFLHSRLACALGIGHLALSIACARTPPQTVPTTPTPTVAIPASKPAVSTLNADILAITQAPGVSRGTWGIVVHSLDRNERLFELNGRSLLVPGSIVKLLSVATAVDAVGWDYRYTTIVG